MAVVLVGMGSNIDAEQHLMQAAHALRVVFADLSFSRVYRSPAIGMQGADFLNACCLLHCDLLQADVRLQLKVLEDAQGRDRTQGSWKPRTLDLDVLMYDGLVVDDELYRYAHAWVPAAELVKLDMPATLEGELTPVSLHL
ncbi:MAG: 2-amino-4-hydroxy-6-hydroxymethyldihydropteridine diphosphokinase [Mariprofundus sp.]